MNAVLPPECLVKVVDTGMARSDVKVPYIMERLMWGRVELGKKRERKTTTLNKSKNND